MTAPPPVLEVEGLRIAFATPHGPLPVLHGVSLRVEAGETLAIVGESGSGKSVTALAIMGLLGEEATVTADRLVLDAGDGAIDLPAISAEALRQLRGRVMAMVFQEPMTSLNPTMPVGRQVAEVLETHAGLSAGAAMQRAIALLTRVGIHDPARRARAFPHELSGGMRQRVMIAMALACAPRLLLADEPTTALDVSVQAQILELIRELRRDGMGVVFITHDLAVVSEIADRVAVMYAGEVVESGRVAAVLDHPRHPYTAALLRSRLCLDPQADEAGELSPIPGQPPSLSDLPPGCAFAPRCTQAEPRCLVHPALEPCGDGAAVRCCRWREWPAGALVA